MAKYKGPINRSIMLGCTALIVVLSLLLSIQTYLAFSNALYDQYAARLRDVVTFVENTADADDLRECIQTGTSSPKRDALQRLLNQMVDDYEMEYIYIIIPTGGEKAAMTSVISSTSAEEREAGNEDLPFLYTSYDGYASEELQRYLDAWNDPGFSFFENDSAWGRTYTGCKPLVTSDGETIALVCADYSADAVRNTVTGYVLHNTLLIVLVCALFGVLLALWLRRNVTGPIHALEQSALRFARMTREANDVGELNFDTEGIKANNEVKQLIDAVVKLSQEMKDQAESAAVVKNYAKEMEEENQRLAEKAEAAIKIAELTQSVTSLLTNMPAITSSKDAKDGKYLACNQAFAEFVHKKDPESVIGLTDFDIFDETTAKHFAEDDKKALSMDEPYVFYEDVLDAEGNPHKFQTTKLKFTDAAGRLCTLGMSVDFTELMRAKRETVEAKAAYEKARSASAMYSHIAHALSANYSRIFYVNMETEEYIEYGSVPENEESSVELRGRDFFRVIREEVSGELSEEDRAGFLDAFTKENILHAVDEHGTYTLTYRAVVDGAPAYYSVTASRMQDDERHIMVGIDNDEAVDVRSELTGLYSETSFSVHSKEILKSHPEGWCLIAIDLEHFKLFNEWYGRDAGDQLLAQIGARLACVEKTTDGLACYMGQDDFCLLAPYDEESIRNLYNNIHEMIMEHGTSVGFMPAIGVCMTDGENTLEELYDRASLASHHAKENYHTRIRVFEESMYKKTERDYQILSDFQQALKDHELFIMLQPQCRIDTGRIVGAESLVRWKKADGQMVSPGLFVPVLEQYGFVTDLDKFVWEEVCVWQRKWIDGGHTPLPVSVNVSQIDIFSIDVPDYFDDLLKKYDLPVDVIKIEITESAYVGDGLVADTVKRLREKGFLVLMDDFGSGYSSLNMLRNLNVDIIKLDAQFLRMSGGDRKGVHILESIVNMAKTMGVPIIVEGVETKEETDFIASLGCRYVQGYYFYRPMPVPDFEALIGSPENIDTDGFVFKVKEEFHTREFLDQNVFSDVMLNNILGPVAFFLLHGEELDCIRYNQQFYNEVDSDQFEQMLKSTQKLVLEEDLPVLYGLLEQAMNDPLNGAADIVRFQRGNGTISQFRLHFFFLDEDQSGMRFYGSVRDITQLDKLNGQMRMISRLSNEEVIFVRKRESGMLFQVTVHGLEDSLGISREEFEQELNSGAFRERVSGYDREWLEQLIRDSDMKMAEFSPAFAVMGTGERPARLQIRFDSVQDKSSGVEYLLILKLADK